MSIITRRPSPRQPSRKPPTEVLSAGEVSRIQKNAKKQMSTGQGKPEPDLEPLPSQHLTSNRRTTTLQHIQQGWGKLSTVIAAVKWRARAKHSTQRGVADSPSQQFGTAEKQAPIVQDPAS